MSCWIFCNAVLAVAQRHRDVAERVLEVVLAVLMNRVSRNPKAAALFGNLYRRGILSRS